MACSSYPKCNWQFKPGGLSAPKKCPQGSFWPVGKNVRSGCVLMIRLRTQVEILASFRPKGDRGFWGVKVSLPDQVDRFGGFRGIWKTNENTQPPKRDAKSLGCGSKICTETLVYETKDCNLRFFWWFHLPHTRVSPRSTPRIGTSVLQRLADGLDVQPRSGYGPSDATRNPQPRLAERGDESDKSGVTRVRPGASENHLG